MNTLKTVKEILNGLCANVIKVDENYYEIQHENDYDIQTRIMLIMKENGFSRVNIEPGRTLIRFNNH